MVLTDREIQAAIQHRQIIIDPPPDQIAYSSTSLDLTLSKFLRVWKTATVIGVEPIIICPAIEGYKFTEVAKEYSESKEMNATETE
jgi:dCTP deaminase